MAGLALLLVYANHFDNGFEFDDTHTIVNNQYIRNIGNVPLFFTDIKYYGTNPGNQSYNPILVTLNAVDYYLAGELNPVYFHASIFIWYIVQLVLMFFVFRHIYQYAMPNVSVDLPAFLSVVFYAFHAANAETINYIIMRSDSFSALCIVAGFYLWQKPLAKKYHLYLLPVLAGILTKEVGVMFAPLLLFYVLLFEEGVSIPELFTLRKLSAIGRSIKKTIPSFVLCFGVFVLIRKIFMPEAQLIVETAGTPWQYFYTQWVVIAHYIGNFLLPLDLSADPDFELFSTVWNRKIILSLLLLLALVATSIVTSAKPANRPISFGILWFFITLAPTSSFIPFGQISNDHRTFLPYIGLVLSGGWAIFLFLQNYVLKQQKISVRALTVCYLIIVAAHAYGTHQRNEVWGSSETLWKDVTEKSPRNGRGWMNYGLIHMQQGRYEEALLCYTQTLELMPYWSYIHINMGILKNAMGYAQEAEQYFLNALRYQAENPEGYYYYATFLLKEQRDAEAYEWVNKGLLVSPGHVNLNTLAGGLKQAMQGPEEKIKQLEELCTQAPSANNYIELSVLYYQVEEFEKCAEASLRAIALEPENAIAYNNLCSAYNALHSWEKAADACQKALQIDPTFERAKNNLNEALRAGN